MHIINETKQNQYNIHTQLTHLNNACTRRIIIYA